MPEPQVLVTGLAIGESPRWHAGRLWLCNWGAAEIIAVDPDGRDEVVTTVPTTIPFSIDWLPDDRLLVVSGQEGTLLRREPDGSLVTHADLTGISSHPWNEIVVDAGGNAYVNSIGFNLMAGEEPAPGIVAVVGPDGSARQVAADVMFPNGMAITPDGSTLIVAESYANQLTAFSIDADGGLSGRRVWAQTGDDHPDGVCLDAEGALWYADVGNRRCVRLGEGSELLETIEVDRGCFACMLGGTDGRTLFMLAAEWSGVTGAGEERQGQVLTTEAPAPHAGRP
jgi:sugar lactone lactonase YvrE